MSPHLEKAKIGKRVMLYPNKPPPIQSDNKGKGAGPWPPVPSRENHVEGEGATFYLLHSVVCVLPLIRKKCCDWCSQWSQEPVPSSDNHIKRKGIKSGKVFLTMLV